MKIDVTEAGLIRLQEVFNPIILETPEGQTFGICMRDDGIAITTNNGVYRKHFYLADMQCIDIGAENLPNSEPGILVQAEELNKDSEGIAL